MVGRHNLASNGIVCLRFIVVFGLVSNSMSEAVDPTEAETVNLPLFLEVVVLIEEVDSCLVFTRVCTSVAFMTGVIRGCSSFVWPYNLFLFMLPCVLWFRKNRKSNLQILVQFSFIILIFRSTRSLFFWSFLNFPSFVNWTCSSVAGYCYELNTWNNCVTSFC